MVVRLCLVLGTVTLASVAVAQQTPSPQPQAVSSVNLPEQCRSVVQAGGPPQGMQGMMGQMQSTMQNMQGEMGQMGDTQKALHEAMMKMDPAMMTGMMAKDADVAWICAMIPHHQGAIDMARAGLKGSDNPESKKLAEKTISENEKSLKELTAWVEQHAARESKNETTGSTK